MLFVGDKGKILAGFRGEDARLLSGVKTDEVKSSTENPQSGRRGGQRRTEAAGLWVAACKGGPATYGDFLLASPISDAFNLGAVSLRLGGRKILFDPTKVQISNLPEANKYLTREYRPGWELAG
jgi:hypothetical protein